MRAPLGYTLISSQWGEPMSAMFKSVSMREAERCRLSGDGRLLGGNAQVEADFGSWPGAIPGPPCWAGRHPATRKPIRSDSMRLLVLCFHDARRRWRGTASAQLDWQAGAESSAELKPTLRMSVKNIAVDGRSLSRQLTMQFRLSGDVIAIERISGSFAGGSLRANGNWSLGKGERRVQISFAGINAAEALLPISDQVASQVDGKVSGLIRVTNGDRLRFRGAITARNSSFFSVPTGTVHSGINGSISRDLRRWEVNFLQCKVNSPVVALPAK